MSITDMARSITRVEARKRRQDHATVLALFGSTDQKVIEDQIRSWDRMFQPSEVLNARRA